MKSRIGIVHVVGVIIMMFFIKIAIADPMRDKADKKTARADFTVLTSQSR